MISANLCTHYAPILYAKGKETNSTLFEQIGFVGEAEQWCCKSRDIIVWKQSDACRFPKDLRWTMFNFSLWLNLSKAEYSMIGLMMEHPWSVQHESVILVSLENLISTGNAPWMDVTLQKPLSISELSSIVSSACWPHHSSTCPLNGQLSLHFSKQEMPWTPCHGYASRSISTFP